MSGESGCCGTFSTRRATVSALEAVLYESYPVLDHGFVRVVDYMGNDAAVVQAARVSYGKGTRQLHQDRGLINYLMRYGHTTPFEMCEIKLHVKLPIFVARQWIRHRTANVNEYSARYSIMDREFYIPEASYLAGQSVSNKQGRHTEILTLEEARIVQDLLRRDAQKCYETYESLLATEASERDPVLKSGLARELARINLTVNCYTQWYWKIDLHNLMHFLALRSGSHAQYEIQVYANVILDILAKWVPLTYEAFEKYRLHSAYLSRDALKVVRQWLRGEPISQEESGLSKREWADLIEVFPAPISS